MPFNPQKHHRHSIRLKGYDYSQPGAYFVTIVTQDRECVFGEIIGGILNLNSYGILVKECWQDIPEHFPNVELDLFVIMPNHVHGVINIVASRAVRARHAVPLPSTGNLESFGKPVSGSIPTIIRSFKSAVSRFINRMPSFSKSPLWQRNYYEHIIRSERDLNDIRKYIINNPFDWDKDPENPNAKL